MSGYTSVAHFIRGEEAEVRIRRGEEGNWFSIKVRDAEGTMFEVTFHCDSAAVRDEMVKELGVEAIHA